MPASPIQAVQGAIESGVRSRAAIAAKTGLEPGTVDLILDHLTASGVLDMEPLGSCPAGGCGSCSAASACAGPSSTRGPVLLKLRRPADR
ncbi:FeoC-like transcriptional regulator [Corynebacterium sp. BF-R-2]|uniref:FeoC-like transcriptional regulator n=1 Tax=Corynebacterium sp. BF-R-2 TaxID=2943494 RepID=UPI00211F2CEA|nr:FeoC-like transcriptional regulator [Corynebacterium sp. BF-R-2]MCQ9676088.1 FeoC-like transcriptional regulator [Corynebacterium sp. BF-R-2]